MKMKKIMNTRRTKKWVWSLFFAVLTSHAGSNYQMNKFVISSGSEVQSGGYVLNSAIGQNVIARSISSSYQMTAGFYQENRDLIFINPFENNK